MVDTCLVTGRIVAPDGTPVRRAFMLFQRLPEEAFVADDATALPTPVTKRTANDGSIEVELIPGAYLVKQWYGKHDYFRIDVPDEPTARLEDIQDDILQPPPSEILQAVMDAEAARDAAEGYRDGAQTARTGAEAARDAAEDAADRAEAARAAARTIFPNTAAGLAATTDGDYFSVPSPDEDEYLILYRNDSGSAVEIRRYPSIEAIAALAPIERPTFIGGVRTPLANIGDAALTETEGGFAIEDADGNRVLEIGPDGATRMVQANAEKVSVGQSSLTEGGDWPCSVTDREGNVLFGVDADLNARMRGAYVGESLLEVAPAGWSWAVGDREGNILLGITDTGEVKGLEAVDGGGDTRLTTALRREPSLWDDFIRARPYPPSSLALWSCGWQWHDSHSFRVTEAGAVLSDSAGPNRNYARSGFLTRDYVWRMIVEAEGDFDNGWTIRSPDNESGMNPRLYCSFSREGASCTFRLFYGTSGSGDDTASLLMESAWDGIGRRRFDFCGIVDGRELLFYVDGRKVAGYEVGTGMDAALGHNFGINAHGSTNGRVRRVEVYRLYDRPAVFPQMISHRMVVNAPFGTGILDGRDPECCLSALERLPRGIGIEFDVRGTSDGGLVIMHDATLDRTTWGSGSVSSKTTEEVTSLKIRGLGGRNVPTFQEMLAALEDRPDIPEILVQYYSGGIESVVSVLNQAAEQVRNRCLIFVSTLTAAQSVRAADPNARICVGSRTVANLDQLPDLVAAGVELALLSPGDGSYAANRGIIPDYKAAGIRIGASTTQRHWTFRRAIEDGVDVILSDYPTSSMR